MKHFQDDLTPRGVIAARISCTSEENAHVRDLNAVLLRKQS